MPEKPKRYCAKCKTAHAGSCPKAKQGWQRRQEGKTTTQRGYGHGWRKTRNSVMARDNHLCQPHYRQGKLVKAHAVDHIIPKSQGGTDDEANLEAICNSCHKEKTQRESQQG